MKRRLAWQLAVILLVLAVFAGFDVYVYRSFTYRYRETASEMMREKSIGFDAYLPFDEGSRIARLDTDFALEGELPVLDGATALFPVYSAFVDATYPEGSVAFDGQDFTAESRLQKTGTGGAYRAVVDGGADIIFTAGPSQAQTEYAEAAGAELVYVPIGYEAFVFIVSAGNSVEALTAEQIRGIYSGRYKNWREVGGEDEPIIQVQRVEGSGSQTAMVAFMQDTPLMRRPTSLTGRAIGYSFRFYVSDLAGKDNLRMLAVDGVYPSEENIRNGTYPVTDPFYAVYRADNDNENIQKLIEWILSAEGQSIVEKTGYVPVI